MKHLNNNELGEIMHQGSPRGPKGVTVVFGGQAGSEGKGKIVGWLANRYDWGAALATFMPNAGHTYVDDDGKEVVVTQLPMALVSRRVGWLGMGASSVLDPEQMMDEVHRYDYEYDVFSRLRIHPRAQVMLPEYKQWERENLSYIASTAKGCGAARAAKARREKPVVLAKDHPVLKEFVMTGFDIAVNDMVNSGIPVLAEQSQGFDLDINHGVSYPYCTSRQCTPAQIVADLGLDGRLVTHSIAVVRSHPIRVGNVEGGTSGEYGSQEIDWDAVSQRAGRDVEEITTVTKRVRRVFEFDWDRISEMSAICRPTSIALTFADYIDKEIFGLTQDEWAEEHKYDKTFSRRVNRFIYALERAVSRPTRNVNVRLVSTGPRDNQTLNYGLIL